MAVQKTLKEIGAGIFAYTQLPGSWGWSNAGLIVDGDQSLLVDTLFDGKLTAEMIETMSRATPAARRIGTVVNTHGNGDHCYGNGVVAGAEIIGSHGCKQDLLEAPPRRNAMLLRAARVVNALGRVGQVVGRVCGAAGLKPVAWLTEAAPFALPLFEVFDFAGSELVPPTRLFEDRLTLRVGDRVVELIEVGPAHTRGDTVLYLPEERVLFAGDILFKDAHPLVWHGPVSKWISACDRLLAMDVETVVPGHGPLTDLSGIRETRAYLQWLTTEGTARQQAGYTVEQTARELADLAYGEWIDAERIYINVHTLYRDLAGDREMPHVLEMLAGMARHARATRPLDPPGPG
jgi:glyoxylase-like metal-dependent hydrolase (beta-lactamase superfamily II)